MDKMNFPTLNKVASLLFLCAFASSLQSCRSRSIDSMQDSIFGEDNRVELPKSYSFIGQLGDGCTAFAIAPRLILTAAHCTFSNVELEWKTYGNNEKFSTTLLARGMTQSSSGRRGQVYAAEVANDWAILKLDHPTVKWLSFNSNVKVGDKIAVIGYSYDLPTASGHNNCQIKGLNTSIVSHDCDLQGGASGGPILKWAADRWQAIGIQSTETCENDACQNKEWTSRNSNRGCILSVEILDKIRDFDAIYRN